MNKMTLENLFQKLDDLVENGGSSDELFASSYIRGFIALAAGQFGDEQQPLSSELAQTVEESIKDAKSELTPQDQVIVFNYWQTLKLDFIS